MGSLGIHCDKYFRFPERTAVERVLNWMGQAITVLFVEDDALIRDSQAQALTDREFRVLSAENGFEALQILGQEHVDVLFTDIVMPDMDGVELAAHAKLLRPDLKIILATGYLSVAKDVRPVDTLLYKPLRAHEIEFEIRKLLNPDAQTPL